MPNQATLWNDALARHSAAVEAICETAGSISDVEWSIPIREGKWSAGQIVDHLNKTYEVAIKQVQGSSGIRVRSPWLLRLIMRQTILRSIYRKRTLPKGARAPSEIRPAAECGTKNDLVERFMKLASEFEEVVRANRATRTQLTHHIFGGIDLLKGIDFIAIHVEHHHRQLAESAKSRVSVN
ncbi:MAG TPA: DinB family protein [Pyrinomonadaceae bacterium]|nr:DinB family protein [Pyrinomonadaceae bacterium]